MVRTFPRVSVPISDIITSVSLVDGYNLPMRIDNNVGCGIPSCPVDLGPNCKSGLALVVLYVV